ncbi:histone-lysine N-methyltransferase SETDB1-B [Achroia grisella]|uniref:histone-lysine N-methyltransferase SETDB1-B n=1 Tax=Achroia grisella TaxID=688607 RepID=UPI0027D21011|nr:histone-lysine N-methyltransferase SETDB1-B [Achroia grisella]
MEPHETELLIENKEDSSVNKEINDLNQDEKLTESTDTTNKNIPNLYSQIYEDLSQTIETDENKLNLDLITDDDDDDLNGYNIQLRWDDDEEDEEALLNDTPIEDTLDTFHTIQSEVQQEVTESKSTVEGNHEKDLKNLDENVEKNSKNNTLGTTFNSLNNIPTDSTEEEKLCDINNTETICSKENLDIQTSETGADNMNVTNIGTVLENTLKDTDDCHDKLEITIKSTEQKQTIINSEIKESSNMDIPIQELRDNMDNTDVVSQSNLSSVSPCSTKFDSNPVEEKSNMILDDENIENIYSYVKQITSKDTSKIEINMETIQKENTSGLQDSNTEINKNNLELVTGNKQNEINPGSNENISKDKLEALLSDEQSVLKDVSASQDMKISVIDETLDVNEQQIEASSKPTLDKELGTNNKLKTEDKPVINIDLQVPPSIDDNQSNIDQVNPVEPSTSSEVQLSIDAQNQQSALDKMVVVTDVTDSLGLLAESSRVIEDDEEADEDEDGEDDEDFDPDDESSNQMTADHSEDSNPQYSEAETKDNDEKEQESPEVKNEEFDYAMTNDASIDKDMDIDEVQCADVDMSTEVNMADDNIETTDNALPEPDEAAKPEMVEPLKSESPKNVESEDTPSVCDDAVAETTQSINISESTLSTDNKMETDVDKNKQSPTKSKLMISQQKNILNIVDLEESSDDDVQEVEKEIKPKVEVPQPSPTDEVISVNIPKDVEVMCTSGGDTSEIVSKQGELVISGLPKPPPMKPARLNTDEVTIKTASTPAESTLVIPETQQPVDDASVPKLGLEIFSLDSDEEDATATAPKEIPQVPRPESPKELTAVEIEKARENNRCINYSCKNTPGVAYFQADAAVVAYYDASRKRKATVCQICADAVTKRTQNLINGIKDFTPLLELDMSKLSQELVEISDSESEDEADTSDEPKETIGEAGAKLLEEQLADIINETWKKYKMDQRLSKTEDDLNKQLSLLEEEGKEIDTLLNECQRATDKLRSDLYVTFEPKRHVLPPLVIIDTLNNVYTTTEQALSENNAAVADNRQKRRLSNASESTSKRPAIPLGYAPLDATTLTATTATATVPAITSDKPLETKTTALDSSKIDDDKDISVVKLSAEAAPSDLPPPGECTRAPLRVGMSVYAIRNVFGSWSLAKITECQPRTNMHQFTICRVRFENRTKNISRSTPARCLAYCEPADCRLTIGTRVIALFKDTSNERKKDSFYSGVVAEIPNPVNSYRYLVFFDDGYAQYVRHADARLVCEASPLVWEEVHQFSRDFVRQYLTAYPERPMVRLHAGQSLKTEWNGRWWTSRVIKVDASLVQVHFEEDNRTEWIYRGSTRLAPLYLELQAAERHRARPMPRNKQLKSNMPYVEYTRSDENKATENTQTQTQTQEEIRRQRAVAKKSTTVACQAVVAPPAIPTNLDSVTSRVVYYTPKNAVKPYKMVPHVCGPKCKRTDVLALKELRTYNPLARPLLSGWERQIVRYKGQKEVMYRAPCGRRLRGMRELHGYLSRVGSDLPVDLFDFAPNTHCLAEFVLNKCLVGKKDLSHGKENVPVPCVNYYDDSLPEFCSYNTERVPTAGVPLNLDPEFLCGCDCTDDCQDKSRCGCWKMTLEGARTIGLDGPNVGYAYKRLPEPLPSGIYECNSRCKCKQTCLNRVAQHPLQLKLQVFKTLNRGWGIRALNDVPKGAFLCVYAGNLLTDATANLDGLNEGDEYLAELDYIEVVEQMKEGYEDDIPEADKKLDKAGAQDDDDDDEPSSSSDEESQKKERQEDDDFEPGHIGLGLQEFNKRLRIRNKEKKDKVKAEQIEKEKAEKEKAEKEKDKNAEDDCITISDDEEVREPSSFMAQAGMKSNEFVPKYRSVRTLFGEDEACYIMDAKVQGNIGRYLNHSCTPNVFVQNVFVDTHDPRFPWVAFFALSHIRAGTELTWNYNYDVGSVPGKVLYCYCGAPNCRGRLL